MIEELRKMFVGKKVLITHSGNRLSGHKDQRGVCKAIHQIPHESKKLFDMELFNKNRYHIFYETKTSTYVEGSMSPNRGSRKIEIVT